MSKASTGIPGFDDIALGGLPVARTTPLTGGPGSGKSTLCSAFIAASCARGEKAVFVSFASRQDEIVQHLNSEGRTSVCTGLLDSPEDLINAPMFKLSTVADTWIQLNNIVHGHARTRDIAMLKSRAPGRARKVRGFELSDAGLTMNDAALEETSSTLLRGDPACSVGAEQDHGT